MPLYAQDQSLDTFLHAEKVRVDRHFPELVKGRRNTHICYYTRQSSRFDRSIGGGSFLRSSPLIRVSDKCTFPYRRCTIDSGV
uniref:Uncharacterized protein n=1 Tax=Picea sitchensis TaxID=3332 RepID=A0A6B9XVI2_PICSI|nr:hypothetical protein Q903MT_gene4018 [Picea sitchensis]